MDAGNARPVERALKVICFKNDVQAEILFKKSPPELLTCAGKDGILFLWLVKPNQENEMDDARVLIF